jgi:hypothetical protein
MKGRHSWCWAISLGAFLAGFSTCAQRLPATPALQAGETIVYQLEISSSRATKVESQVTSPQSPPAEELVARCLLQVHVLEASLKGFRLKTYLSKRNLPQASGAPPETQPETPDKVVELFVARDGTASDMKGITDLTVTEQFAWNAWLNRFSSSMTFPKSGVRPSQRWKSSENEASPAPIAGLSWEQKYEYVKQESCDTKIPVRGNSGSFRTMTDTCAVILVHARLRQRTSPQNTTPEDYRHRSLTTSGTATGTNETILYISTTTGLLVHSSEDAQQSMDVTVSLADGSNKIRYMISAKSRSQIELLPDVPQDIR